MMSHLHKVIIEDSQHAKLGVARVVVFREAEVEAALQPPCGTRHVQAVGGNLLHRELGPETRDMISKVTFNTNIRVSTHWDGGFEGKTSYKRGDTGCIPRRIR